MSKFSKSNAFLNLSKSDINIYALSIFNAQTNNTIFVELVSLFMEISTFALAHLYFPV